MLFLAGFVDAIGGGGGLISLPAYLFAGLPVHQAIATNKLSSSCGTALSTARFLKNGLVNLKLVLPAVAAAFAGSFLGARLNRRLCGDGGGEAKADRRTVTVCILSALVIGVYDGFYGPGTGTFLIIAFTVFAKMSVPAANAQAKVINLTTNITSLTVFLLNGQVLFPLGLAGAACNMAGNWIGSGLALSRGVRIVRPVILTVLALLLAKILFHF